MLQDCGESPVPGERSALVPACLPQRKEAAWEALPMGKEIGERVSRFEQVRDFWSKKSDE